MTAQPDAHARMLASLRSRRPDFALERPFYVDPAFHELDIEHVWKKQWLFVGHACEVAQPGQWFRVDIANESLIVVRGRDGGIKAFHNTCRHRGARVCLAEKGRSARLVCPYHQWSYDLDGRLVKARDMGEDFDVSEYGLGRAHCEDVGGWIFVSLAETPPSIETFRRNVAPYLAPVDVATCKVAHESTVIEKGNWKLVLENNRECYHCAAHHPELTRTLAEYDAVDDPRCDPAFADLMRRKNGEWQASGIPYAPTPHSLQHRAVRLPYIDGAVAMTLDGKLASARLLGAFTDPDMGSVRMLSLPNTWNHLGSDHVVSFRVLPLSATETLVTTKWLVHKDAVEGVDYDVARLTHVWSATNDQDRELVEMTQAGVASSHYRPGPYSSLIEMGVQDFVDWYCATMAEALDGDRAVAIAAE